MKEKKIITTFKSYKDYDNQYNFLLNFHKKKLLTEEEVQKYKKGKFYKISDKFYVKLPRLTRKIWLGITLAAAGLLVAGSAATITVFYIPHEVNINSNTLEIIGDKTARLASDYKCSLKLKDDVLPTRYMDYINITSVKVNNKEIPIEDYSFIYQTNAKNQLTINKKHLGGKIEIDAELVKREKHKSFWFEFNIADYADFSKTKVKVPTGETVKITKEMETSVYTPLFLKAFNVYDKTFNIVDNVILNDNINLVLIDKATYTIAGVSFSTPFDMIFLREDNTVKYNIIAKDGVTLPKNLWLRSNARYTKKGEDFFLEFASDYKSATLEIPYYFIRDNGSLAINPDVEDK